MKTVFPAKRYQPGQMGSLGKASYMILKQHDFPWEFPDEEVNLFLEEDSDRVFAQRHEHAHACVKKHTKGGELSLGSWFKAATDKEVLEFIKEFIQADPSITWTGYRILGTVHRGNGFPVFTLQIFAKPVNSKTKVYSGCIAPNVES